MTSDSFDTNRNQESITGLTLKIGSNIKHNDKWSGTYVFLPKVSSDFKKIGQKDFQYRNLDRMIRDYNYWSVNQHDSDEYRVALKE